jgi:hypothetical protein
LNTAPEQVGFPCPPQDGFPKQAVRFTNRGHVTSRPATKAGQLSLVIPKASTLRPPKSRAVPVNLGKSSEPAVPGFLARANLDLRFAKWMSKRGELRSNLPVGKKRGRLKKV